MKCSNEMGQFAYRVGTAFVKLTFHLPASGSWSIILNSILRITLEICQPETIKGCDQQFRIFFEFKESCTWHNYLKPRSEKVFKPLKFIIKGLILTHEDIVIFA